MSKNNVFKLIVALLFLGGGVVWLLFTLKPEWFGGVEISLSWVLTIAFGIIGLLLIFRGIFSKKLGLAKKKDIIIGALFIVAAILGLVGTFIPNSLVLPIIAIVVALTLVLVYAFGGKKWDDGDNKAVGYKNYRERKKEENK